jgi:hypothetical protein
MRKVHDIIIGRRGSNGGHPVVISFVQHGNRDDGFVYENVCPYCAVTIEKVTVHPEAAASEVYKRLQAGMHDHIYICTHRGAASLNVEKTSGPLGTEKLIKEL